MDDSRKNFHNFLKGNKIKHQIHPKLIGKPDILLVESKTAIFLHGCFWHKCPKCYREPKKNMDYWLPKIANNINRDKKNTLNLKKSGYKVIKIWEHNIKNNQWKNNIKNIIG